MNKNLRNRRLAPVLIKEVTRRVNLKGVFHAIYTAGNQNLPGIFNVCPYYHRCINVSKLVECKFMNGPLGESWGRFEKRARAPLEYPGEGEWRLARLEDSKRILELFDNHFNRINCGGPYIGQKYDSLGNLIGDVPKDLVQELSGYESSKNKKALDYKITQTNEMLYRPKFNEEMVKHFIIGNNDKQENDRIVSCYVRVVDNHIKDFITLYSLTTQVLKKTLNDIKEIKIGYTYYSGGDLSRVEHLLALTKLASDTGHDVLNTLDHDNSNTEILSATKFGIGDGSLAYFCYNWQGPLITKQDCGVILP